MGTAAAAEAAADTSIVVAAAASIGTGSLSAILSDDDSSLHWHTHVMRLTNPLARETAQLYAPPCAICTSRILFRFATGITPFLQISPVLP
jgi:hypothetical protein